MLTHMVRRSVVLLVVVLSSVLWGPALPASSGDPAAVISKTPQHYYISGVSGWIKPKVNGKSIHGPMRLKDMDVIKIGSVVLQFAASVPLPT